MNWDFPLSKGIQKRQPELRTPFRGGIRLFNGYTEGCPDLVVDLFGQTLLLTVGDSLDPFLDSIQSYIIGQFPWIDCIVLKKHGSPNRSERNGTVTFGNKPANQVEEAGIHYALDLTMNQDASFYLDTRNLRAWLQKQSAGWKVLNTFAYTGSLGVAALAGGAEEIIQTDKNKRFLDLIKKSNQLNNLDLQKVKIHPIDFFTEISRLKHAGILFDCVILDPPFFSTTSKGTVDMVNQGVRMINKCRPLVKDGGRLISINNALFVSGLDIQRSHETICADGYLQVESIIPAPEDITGYPDTITGRPPVDPFPYNHPTKITIFKVLRK